MSASRLMKLHFVENEGSGLHLSKSIYKNTHLIFPQNGITLHDFEEC